MKIVFGILASTNENYKHFQNVWIENIRTFKSGPNKDMIDFYFIYKEQIDRKYERVEKCDGYWNYFSEYVPDMSMMDSFVWRSIDLMEYVYNTGQFDYFIRTNLSTLFDLQTLLKWAEAVPKLNFIAGSVIDKVCSYFTHLSGTNIILTRDLVKFIILNKHNILPESVLHGDDERISSLIIENVNVNVLLLKRIDFIEMKIGDRHIPPVIVYQSCISYDNIFCFRFKTFNRNNDVKYMMQLQKDINSEGFCLKQSMSNVLDQGYYTDILKQNPGYETLTCNIFTFGTAAPIANLYNYKNANIQRI